jgi:hypothetical protein
MMHESDEEDQGSRELLSESPGQKQMLSGLKKYVFEVTFLGLIGMGILAMYLQCVLLTLTFAVILLPLSLLLLWLLVSDVWHRRCR